MSADGQSRQPKGVPVGGEYAAKARTETSTTLAAPPTYLERLTSLCGQTFGPQLAEAVALETLTGYQNQGFDLELAVAYQERYSHATYDRRAAVDLPMLTEGGFSLDDVDALTSRFGDEPRAWSVLHAGIGPDRASHLAELGVTTPSAMIAMDPMGDAAISAWITAVREHPALNEWVGAVANLPVLHQAGITPGKALECARYDVDQQTARRTPAIDPEMLHRYAARAKMDAAAAADRLLAGIDPKLAAKFGSRISVADTVALDNALVPGPVARSLRAKEGRLPVAAIIELNAAGVVTGAQYVAWRTAAGAADSRLIAALAVAGLSPEQVAGYRKNAFDTGQWIPLHQAGFGDVTRWAKAGIERRSQARNGFSSAAQPLVAFAAAGGTPARLGELSRAGISLQDAATFINSTDPWADGQVSRDAALADEVRMHQQWGNLAAKPTPWPWTRDTYAREATS